MQRHSALHLLLKNIVRLLDRVTLLKNIVCLFDHIGRFFRESKRTPRNFAA